ncbi:N-acetylmuramoyl-L-alanine amidase [Patescibacteria group bacterium]
MNFFKRAAVGITIGVILLVLVVSGLLKIETAYGETNSFTFQENITIQMDSRKFASQPQLLAPYKTMDVFISEEKESSFEFTSVGGQWSEILPSGTSIESQVRFRYKDQWTEWLDLEEDDDFESPGTKFALASTDLADAFQFKYLLYGDGVSTPKVQNPEWTFIKAGKSISTEAPPSPKYSSNATVSASKNLALTASSTGLGIISRQSWGADEKWRYLRFNGTEEDIADMGEEYYEKYKDELTYANVITTDEWGEVYKWPLEYPNKVQKLIIHHTATTSNLDNPAQAIRDIYYYHSVVRGWGDIGYNYLIDQNGNIYEGRFGGDSVIGGHAAGANNGSIGIAVLGNYESNPVPTSVMNSLGKLISQKSRLNGINPSGYDYFRGEFSPNIIGHRDVASTTCPGTYLYEKLPVLRTYSEEIVTEKPKFVKEFDYQDRSDIYYLELGANQSKEVTIKFENIGTKDWNSETFIVVNENPDFNGVIEFPNAESYVLARMQESLVEPGEIATFKFYVQSSSVTKVVEMHLAPVVDGYKKIDDYKKMPVSVQQNNFKYEFVSADKAPERLNVGESFSLTIKLKNTGNTPWNNSGNNVVRIGTDHVRDRISPFLAQPGTRIGYLQNEIVNPGEIGIFEMKLQAPQEPGYYKEYYTPVVEGVTWMADSGMNFSTTVFGGNYQAEVVEKTPLNTWERGKKYVVWVKLRNVGEEDWTKESFDPILLTEDDLNTEDAQLMEADVKPGEMGTLNFIVHVDPNEKIETKALLMRPKVNGVYITKQPIYFYYNVRENSDGNYSTFEENVTPEPKKVSAIPVTFVAPSSDVKTLSGTQGDIRVKIGFEGDPEVSSLGSFEVYSGNSLLATMSAGEVATAKYENNYYYVDANNKTFKKSEYIRFVPKNNAILEIKNFENRPAWDQTLNDNEYRGSLEFRMVSNQKTMINELPLEDYLKGIGEVSNSADSEKAKTILVAARTYAKYYMDIDQKFPGMPYDLDDNPDVSQKYLGYGFEKRAPNIIKAVEETEGQFVTYGGVIVKTPYFNQSDSGFTKSAKDVWDWDANYLVGVDDSFCAGDVFLGHGVGLSGCGATGMASFGYNYVQILKYYYSGVEISDMY